MGESDTLPSGNYGREIEDAEVVEEAKLPLDRYCLDCCRERKPSEKSLEIEGFPGTRESVLLRQDTSKW